MVLPLVNFDRTRSPPPPKFLSYPEYKAVKHYHDSSGLYYLDMLIKNWIKPANLRYNRLWAPHFDHFDGWEFETDTSRHFFQVYMCPNFFKFWCYTIFFLMQNGSFMYSQTSPGRVWNDIGWKATPVIIPHLGREGKLSRRLAILHTLGYILIGYEPNSCPFQCALTMEMPKQSNHHYNDTS